MSKIYIAGPMTGYDHCNILAFFQAAKWLKENPLDSKCMNTQNDNIVNPAQEALEKGVDLDSKGFGVPFIKVIGNDLLRLSDCTHLVLIKGWQGSTGALMELMAAKRSGTILVYELEYDTFGKIQDATTTCLKDIEITVKVDLYKGKLDIY